MTVTRPVLVLAGLLLLPLVPAGHATHGPHGNCGDGTFSVGNSVRTDVWANNDCAGATTYLPNAACIFIIHAHALGVHAMVLHDNGCETGVLVTLP